MRAFVDTGNFLRDPVSGKPAAVLSASCGKKLMEEVAGAGEESLKTRICVIPYSTVGEKGILQGVRPDRVIVEGKTIEKSYWQSAKRTLSAGTVRNPMRSCCSSRL